MKNLFILIFTCLLGCINAPAQFSESIRVKGGENIYEKVATEIYLYPSFVEGTIFFKNGQANQSWFNYNFLVGEMQFISPAGDTLSIADPVSIKFVKVLKDTFFFNKVYLQLVLGNNAAKLAINQIFKVVDNEKIGAYDQPLPAGAITSYNLLSSDRQSYKLDVRHDLILNKKTSFYIGDENNNFFNANKKNLLKKFSKKQIELNRFLKKNNINFNEVGDLIKLVNFLRDPAV